MGSNLWARAITHRRLSFSNWSKRRNRSWRNIQKNSPIGYLRSALCLNHLKPILLKKELWQKETEVKTYEFPKKSRTLLLPAGILSLSVGTFKAKASRTRTNITRRLLRCQDCYKRLLERWTTCLQKTESQSTKAITLPVRNRIYAA